MSSWHSYPKIYNLGHAALHPLFDGEVVIEEKLDGSQFSFGVFDGELKVRSRGREFPFDGAEKMFQKAVDSVLERKTLLVDGYTYRGEYFEKPKHNTLAYSRIPNGHIAIFDVSTGDNSWLGAAEKVAEAERIGLSHVPVLYVGTPGTPSLEWFESLIGKESVLGGAMMEGVVVKNYSQFGPDKKTLMGKHVCGTFREKHRGEWRNANPTGKDFIDALGDSYKAEARWKKAIQHMREDGRLDGSPKDIGPLLKEIQSDIKNECKEEILVALWKWAEPQIMRASVRGFPEWFKEELLKSQFELTQ